MFRQENGRRIGNGAQTAVGHRKDTEFVDGTETIFKGANQTEVAVGVAFKVQNRIDDVLKHAGSGESTVLCHMPHENERGTSGLGQSSQSSRTFPNLRNAARSRFQIRAVERLNGVDDNKLRFGGGNLSLNALKLNFAHEPHAAGVQPNALRTQSNLRCGFFARHVKGRFAKTHHARKDLQQQRGLADAGVAADQTHATGNQP